MAESISIHLEYTFTQREWRDARLAARSGSRKKVTVWASLIIFAAVVLGLLTRLGQPPPPTSSPAPEESLLRSYVLPFVPWVLVWGFVAFFVLRKNFGASAWKRNPVSERVYTLDIDNQGLQLATNIETTRWRWEAFIGSSEMTRLLLLRLETNAVLPIPKRAANAAQLEHLRKLAKDRAVPRSGGFPVRRTGPDDPVNRRSPTCLSCAVLSL